MKARPVGLIGCMAAALAVLAGCKPSDDTRARAVIGAVLIDGAGSPPVSRSVMVVAGTRIRSIGEQASTPIPAGAEKVNGAGRFLIPAPVAIPATLPRIATLGEAKAQIDGGAVAVQGMILDTEEIPASLLHKWRDLQVVFVPRLGSAAAGDAAARARRNTALLASAGVLIAGDGEAEWKQLREAGLSPAQVVAAATRNAARAAGQSAELGVLAPGLTASAWLLKGNPLEDAAQLAERNAERVMSKGEWAR